MPVPQVLPTSLAMRIFPPLNPAHFSDLTFWRREGLEPDSGEQVEVGEDDDAHLMVARIEAQLGKAHSSILTMIQGVDNLLQAEHDVWRSYGGAIRRARAHARVLEQALMGLHDHNSDPQQNPRANEPRIQTVVEGFRAVEAEDR